MRVAPQLVAIGLEPEQDAQEEKRRARRPRLRARRRRVLHREARPRAPIAREHLRQAEAEVRRRFERRARHARGLIAEAVARKPVCDERVVVWPDGAVVVADRVVAGLAFGHRAHAPTREEGGPEEMRGDLGRLVLVHDAAPEQVPDVRGDAVDAALLAVEGEREAAPLRDPEILVEATLQLGRLALEAHGELVVVPVLAREPRATHLYVVDVALDLARRDRPLGDRAVGEADRVPRVLPALVLESRLDITPLVFDVAVAVAVAVLVDPRERRARGRLELAHQLSVAAPALVLFEQNEEERRRVGAAVVRRVRSLAEVRELAEADLVQIFPGSSSRKS